MSSNINQIQPMGILWMTKKLFLSFIVLLTSSTNGQEYSCKVEVSEGCITKVTCTIPDAYAREGRPFTVSYESQDGKTENAAVLHNVGYYVCESAGDHICDKNDTSVTINSNNHCVSGREYKLTADGENGIPCSKILMAESNKTTDTGCSDGTSDDASGKSSTSGEGDVTKKRVQKRAANKGCKPKLNTEKEEISKGQDSSNNIAIGVGCGVAALAVILIIGSVYFIKTRTRKLDGFTCQWHGRKHGLASTFLTSYCSRNAKPPDPDVEASTKMVEKCLTPTLPGGDASVNVDNDGAMPPSAPLIESPNCIYKCVV